MPIIHHREVPERERRPGHRVRNLVGPEQGAQGLTLTVSVLDQGAVVPLHTHRIEEAIVVQEGQGVFHLGKETVTVGPDATVLVPPETIHGFHNAGPVPLTVLAASPSSTRSPSAGLPTWRATRRRGTGKEQVSKSGS